MQTDPSAAGLENQAPSTMPRLLAPAGWRQRTAPLMPLALALGLALSAQGLQAQTSEARAATVPSLSVLSAAEGAGSDDPCTEFVARLPNVKSLLCNAAQLQPTEGRSVQGRTLWSRDVVAPDARIRVLVVGAMHGDELSSASVALHWIQRAVETPSNAHWRFIPALNPDGLMARPARRTNIRGVDLNRNFPTPNWKRDAKIYWEQRTRKDPRRWPGPSPLSEPESRYLFDEMARFKPDLVVSIHAPYGMLDFDGPTVPPARLGRLYLDQIGIFPGSLGHFGGVHKGMPVVTIELHSAIRTPLDAEMRQMWLDLLRWMSERVVPEPSSSKLVPVKLKPAG